MKILDKYVLREHLGPLIFALSALTSLLLLNYVAKQFARLVGRGLPWSVIGEFFLLSLPFVIAMTLPMAVLVATLYAFSRLSSESEITALKASGLSMPRLMLPVVIAACFVSLFMVWFNDVVLPAANHQLATLQQDIARVKPTFALNEQVINPVSEGRLYLRAGRIAENTNRMYEVVIYTLDNPQNRRTIYADSGDLSFAHNSNDLLMHLYDGSVNELPTGERHGELQRIFFDRQIIRVPDVASSLERSEDREFKTDREMSICEMQAQSVTQATERERSRVELERSMMRMTTSLVEGRLPPVEDSTAVSRGRVRHIAFGLGGAYCRLLSWVTPSRVVPPDSTLAASDSTRDLASGGAMGDTAMSLPVIDNTAAPRDTAMGTVPASQAAQRIQELREAARMTPSTVAGMIESSSVRYSIQIRQVRQLQVEIEKKFALAAACVIFVLFGAPLALRFPRGGVGLVLGISIVAFALYYIGLIGGETLADRGIVSPFVAMWGANMVFAAIGLVLIMRMGREAGSARGSDWRELLAGAWERLTRRRASSRLQQRGA